MYNNNASLSTSLQVKETTQHNTSAQPSVNWQTTTQACSVNTYPVGYTVCCDSVHVLVLGLWHSTTERNTGRSALLSSGLGQVALINNLQLATGHCAKWIFCHKKVMGPWLASKKHTPAVMLGSDPGQGFTAAGGVNNLRALPCKHPVMLLTPCCADLLSVDQAAASLMCSCSKVPEQQKSVSSEAVPSMPLRWH